MIIIASVGLTVSVAEGAPPASPRSAEVGLGRYEKLALAEALEREGTTIERHPEGKVVGRIRTLNLEVFSARDGFLRALNVFHVTTKKYIIAREVLLRPGMLWNQELVDETARNLEVPEYSSLIVIVPVRSDAVGRVDILVVTRDVWSLRTNAKYEIQNSTLVRLVMFPSENNFLGRRKQIGASFELDLGALAIGPRYLDPNILGTRLVFEGSALAIFNRRSHDYEGRRLSLGLQMPLYSLASAWGALLSVDAADFVTREFRDTDVVLYPDPLRAGADPNEERAPREFRLKTVNLRLEGVLSRGSWFKSRFFAGYALDVRRPSLLGNFPGSPALATLFEDEVLGRSERLAGPVLRYEGFVPTFAKYMNVDTLDLIENVRLGPRFLLALSPALKTLGSDVNLFRFRASASLTVDIAERGFVSATVQAGARVEGSGVSDADVGLTIKAALPPMGRVGRFIIVARAQDLVRNGRDEVLVAGAQNGLRGFRIGEFFGETLVTASAELRTVPLRIKALRVAGVAFWDVGHAAASYSDLHLHHDVGIGLRTVLLQDTRFVNRFDWAIALDGDNPGFPGRISISFGQFF